MSKKLVDRFSASFRARGRGCNRQDSELGAAYCVALARMVDAGFYSPVPRVSDLL